MVEAGVINLGTSNDLSCRLGNLLDDVTIMVCAHEPNVVGVESPFVGRFASAVIPLAGARGVILAACSNGIIKVTSISPTEVKVSTGADRRAKKPILAIRRAKWKIEQPANVRRIFLKATGAPTGGSEA